MTATFHPVADIFPMMSDQEVLGLVADIREHGQHEPIWLHRDGRIIDGRNRHLACQRLRIEPKVRTYEGDDASLAAFVVSVNLHRRHLSESQRGIVAARIATYAHGGDRVSEQAANLPLATQSEAAALLNVSKRTVHDAKKVLDKGGPELTALVESGDVKVSAAASVAEAVREDIAGLAHEDAREVVKAAAQVQREGRIRPIGRPVVPFGAPGAPAPESAADIVDRVAKHTPAGAERERSEWRTSLLAAIARASTSLASFQNEDIAEHGGDVVIDQLGRLAKTLTDKHADVTARRQPAGRPNLRIAK